jgi:hypothetical protein
LPESHYPKETASEVLSSCGLERGQHRPSASSSSASWIRWSDYSDWTKLVADLGFEGFRIHDLRATMRWASLRRL